MLDTEVLFALDPKDKHHARAAKLFTSRPELVAPDSSMLEFGMVLRTMRVRTPQIKQILLALDQELTKHGASQKRTIDALLLARQCELESTYNLTFFDSLVAASALALDRIVVSDDDSFDIVPGLERIPVS